MQRALAFRSQVLLSQPPLWVPHSWRLRSRRHGWESTNPPKPISTNYTCHPERPKRSAGSRGICGCFFPQSYAARSNSKTNSLPQSSGHRHFPASIALKCPFPAITSSARSAVTSVAPSCRDVATSIRSAGSACIANASRVLATAISGSSGTRLSPGVALP